MEYIAAGCVVIGVGWTSYLIGVKDGGAKMIDMLELLKIIIVDEHDQVSPNKQYGNDTPK